MLAVVLARTVAFFASLLAFAGLGLDLCVVGEQSFGGFVECQGFLHFNLCPSIEYFLDVCLNVFAFNSFFDVTIAEVVAEITCAEASAILFQTGILSLASAAAISEVRGFLSDLHLLHLLLDELVLLDGLFTFASVFGFVFAILFTILSCCIVFDLIA